MMLQKHLSFRLSSFGLFRERSGNFKQFLSRCCRGENIKGHHIKSKWNAFFKGKNTRHKRFIQNAKCKPNDVLPEF